MVQDTLAILVALAAAAWLAWTLRLRLKNPSCGPRDVPDGTDGFVSLNDLRAGAKKSGQPEGRPDR